ncbi:type VII secretion protein EccB [Pseudonocardia asaccharolytica]|uniref:type VII secretion protein EccB n=1 Tax=Pseudonocardia asaccharolytica TaxID=54010 RepID=UPI0013765BE3|nr:type VII secretion protein EccB [Pseudonocardia asaccharolytica]
MPRAAVTRAPVTRDHADAYRYGLRRLESALVSGDPVPLHEQIRSQRRAAFAGVLVALLALGGVAIYALIAPRPDWTRQLLVVGDRSGSMYVVAHDPDRLVPVANLAAGRLVLAALGNGGGATAVPVVVRDEDLAPVPRTPTAAIAGAVAVHPDGPGIPPRWSVCDRTTTAGRPRPAGTTVVAGAAATEPTPGVGVLLAVPDGGTYAVIEGHRHRIGLSDRPVLAALGLAGRSARPASSGMVSGIPEGLPLVTPELPAGRGPAGVPGRVGDVLTVTPIGAPGRYYVVLPDGLQEVPALAAQVLAATTGREPVEVGTGLVASVPLVDTLDVAGWPAPPTRWAEPADAPVVCWTWTPEATSVQLGDRIPAPDQAVVIDLAQADGPGDRVDAVVLGPGGGGPVRSTAPGQPSGTGSLWLISATGVGYGVADHPSAAALGINGAEPAPEAALRLLPTGPALDLAAAARVVDVGTSAIPRAAP